MSRVGKLLMLVLTLSSLGLVVGCGGGSQHYDPNNVVVTITPSSANVPAGGTLTLQASATGECIGCATNIQFAIQEMEANGGSGAQCNWVTGDSLPAGPCPYGTLEIESGVSTKTTFHAPNTAETVHVVAIDYVPQLGNSLTPIEKTATATVVVQ